MITAGRLTSIIAQRKATSPTAIPQLEPSPSRAASMESIVTKTANHMAPQMTRFRMPESFSLRVIQGNRPEVVARAPYWINRDRSALPPAKLWAREVPEPLYVIVQVMTWPTPLADPFPEMTALSSGP